MNMLLMNKLTSSMIGICLDYRLILNELAKLGALYPNQHRKDNQRHWWEEHKPVVAVPAAIV
jgi:hypothetical protein